MAYRVTRTSPPGQSEPPKAKVVLIVAYCRETDRYYLQDQATGARFAGPFRTSLMALEFARSSIALER